MTRLVVAAMLVVALFVIAAAGAALESPDRAPYRASRPSVCPPGKRTSPVRVLVAARLIPKGTPGSVIAKKGMHKPFTLPCGEREPGAIGNPADLTGRVAVYDIFPGQQLTTFDFRVVSGVHKVSLTSPVRAGHYLSLTVLVAPRAECTFTVIEGNHSSTILPGRVGGHITWRWQVGQRTPTGRLQIIVRCGESGTLRLSVRVLGDPSVPPYKPLKTAFFTPGKLAECDFWNYTEDPERLRCRRSLLGRATEVNLWPTERPKFGRITVNGFESATPDPRLVRFGKTWQGGPFRCVSRTSGLTCRSNASGHGFWMGRLRAHRVF